MPASDEGKMGTMLTGFSTRLRLSGALVLCAALAACSGGGGSSGSPDQLSAAARLGQKIFVDQTLSVSGKQSCATCHVAGFAFASDNSAGGPDHGLPVPLGGPNMDLSGFRNTPSLMYASFIPAFFFDGDGNPNGGFFRDGRAATLADQAIAPFTTAFEMANADAAAVIEKLKTRPYLADFTAIYGADVLNDPDTALKRMGAALAAYETEDPDFHPFSSKFDYWRNGQATLTSQELNGFALFNNSTKGNCAACHPTTSANGSTPAMFTDFSFDNLGLPRNANIPANADSGAPDYTPVNSDDGVHTYYDLGVCGPLRDDPGLNKSGICGQFKVPTLRNIAVTAPYFHNGQFATLADAIGFYVRRDTNPEQFYPTDSGGNATKFDDLPALYGGQFLVNINEPSSDANYAGNVNTGEIPYNRRLGGQAALTPDEINDVIVFLCTLTDGYDPAHPAAQVLPAQCRAAVTASTP
ncbi:cytochrome-c peroxidase [Nevskia soli]|uniref:cytochrome-c peroxidase n=1 Tax=Nevskia soli TaxID=418856 RepID=UPI001B8048C3|nr:cytochrome c peroxidase [Nevskia soli]